MPVTAAPTCACDNIIVHRIDTVHKPVFLFQAIEFGLVSFIANSPNITFAMPLKPDTLDTDPVSTLGAPFTNMVQL